MKSQHQVVVVGAGPVGLLLTGELARRGVDVALIEQLPQPVIGSKGKGLQPRSLELFEQLGVLSDFLASGSPYPSFRIHGTDGTREEPYALPVPPSADRPYPNILMVPQWQTEAILRRWLATWQVPVHLGCALVRLKPYAGAAVASVRDAGGLHEIRAEYVVGCDGARSLVRSELGVPFSGQTLPRRAIFADLAIDGLDTTVWHRWPDAPGGQTSLCPLLGKDVFQLAAELPAEGEVDLSLPALRSLLGARTGLADTQIKSAPWTSLFRLNLRLAERYRVGRVLLAGDAAHAHPPTGGQGLNTGIQDAFNLGWKLAAVLRGASSALLDSYEAERRAVARDMLELSGALLSAWQERRKTQRGALTSQLDLHYRDAALSLDLCPRREGTLRAGDRAPDALLQASTGHSVRLFALLQHPGFTLLGYDLKADLLPSMGADVRAHAISASSGCAPLWDARGDLQRAYGLEPGTLVLIRPDGYVGVIAAEEQRSEVRTYLQRWLGPTAGR